LFVLLLSSITLAQNKYLTVNVADTFRINLENEYFLSAVSVVPFSENVLLNRKKLSRPEYEINYPAKKISLSTDLQYSLFDTLVVKYQAVFIPLKKEYKNKTLVVHYDDLHKDSILVAEEKSVKLTPESIFGANLKKSGAVIRGFTLGTNKDFSLTSGLRLQLSGKLSDDIEIVAALTDENTPIQPEGNSERLEELDKVFIQIRHPNAEGTFGDYDLITDIGEFGKIHRKLQGLKAVGKAGDYSASVYVASSRGKFTTNNFQGIDGVQGPYILRGENNEKNIIIIAGSERVYVDGRKMVRGENNDYVIEYSNAQITFTPKVLITSASRIIVDFEYTDRKYERNIFGGTANANFWKDKLSLKIGYSQEGDDKFAPIDFILNDDDRKILENAGDDFTKASKSGVTLAQPDSTDKVTGTYTKVDTVINGKDFSYYVYMPGSPSAIYNVRFSFVGEGKGDYVKEGLGNYKFTGIGKGAYLPLVFLPLPQLKQSGNILLTGKPFKDVTFGFELAGSMFDKNRFSELDDGDNGALAGNMFLNIGKQKVEIGDVILGEVSLKYNERYTQSRFTTIDRYNEIEFNRNYNITEQTNQNSDERLRRISLSFSPVKQLNILSRYDYLSRGSLQTDRYINQLKLHNEKDYDIFINTDYLKNKNNLRKTKWLRSNGNISFSFWKIKTGVEFLYEDKNERNTENDTLLNSSLKYEDLLPYLSLLNIKSLSLALKYSFRNEYFPLNGILQKESWAHTQIYSLTYTGKRFKTGLDITVRNKKYTWNFAKLGRLDNETILVRSDSRFNFLKRFVSGNLYYNTATEKTAKLERVFIRVPQGTGNYEYLGDLNNNGIADENEFAPTIYNADYILTTIPTDELFPVINLKANVRVKLEPSRLIKPKSFLAKAVSALTDELSFRVEEKSKEKDLEKIYLMKFSNFLNDSTTIHGFNVFQNDFYIFKGRRDISLRFRYLQRNSLNQFNTGIEKGYYRQRSARLDFRLVKEINVRSEYVNLTDNLIASVNSNRARLLTENLLSLEFSYRPLNKLEIGFKIRTGRDLDEYPANPTIIDFNSQTLRMTYSMLRKGRIRFEIERNELNPNTTENKIPFEILKGNTVGKNYRWMLNFDYRIARYLQITANYTGRLQGSGKVINILRAEARAHF